jgi:hypothetical protein
MQMPPYRQLERNATLHEYYCVEFDEEVMYGHRRQKTSSK